MGWKLYRGIPKHHNYQKKLAWLIEHGGLNLAPGVHDMAVYHDDWCGIYKGKHCNCAPDLRLKTVWTPRPQG